MVEYVILALIVIGILFFLNKEKLKQKFFPEKEKNYTIDDQFNSDKREREKEIDRLLGKMGKNGLGDLSPKERKRLDELSRK